MRGAPIRDGLILVLCESSPGFLADLGNCRLELLLVGRRLGDGTILFFCGLLLRRVLRAQRSFFGP